MKITKVEAIPLRIPDLDGTRADGIQDDVIVRVHTDAETAQYVPRVSVSFMKRPTPVRDTTCWIALLASSRTRTDCSDSS